MTVFVESSVFIGKLARCLIALMSPKNPTFFIFHTKAKCSNVTSL